MKPVRFRGEAFLLLILAQFKYGKTATAHPPPRGPRARQNNNNNISVEIGRRTGRLTLLVEVFWLPGLGPQEVDKGGRVEADLQKVDKLDKPVDKVEDYGRPR